VVSKFHIEFFSQKKPPEKPPEKRSLKTARKTVIKNGKKT
jgi:hypothetical protein